MTKEQFLKDTIDYYSADINRRCVVKSTSTEIPNFCAYSPKTAGLEGISEGCAIGRHLSPELKDMLDIAEHGQNGPDAITGLIRKPELRELFPQWMRDMSVDFLASVQLIHDRSKNWELGRGLSEQGKIRVNTIISNFNLQMEKYETLNNIEYRSIDSLL